MSFFKKKKETARETAKKITDGIKAPQHLGKQTFETINQELFSLQNTKSMFRDSKWNKRIEKVEDSVKEKLRRNSNSIMCQVWLRDIERIRNQR